MVRPPISQPLPTPVLPPQQPAYVQNYRSSMQPRIPQPNTIVHVAQVGYDSMTTSEGEVMDDYVENLQGELVPMYYTSAQLQYRPTGRMVIRCFGCGGPHKKVDHPNCSIPSIFIPL